MHVSEDADELVREIRELRAARQQRLQCDLHYINAEYDRRLRRIDDGRFSRTSIWSYSIASPICLRRRCRWGLRRLRRRLAMGADSSLRSE